MNILEKVRAQAEVAASKAKEGIEDLQAKRELGQLYGELGREVFDRYERGEPVEPVAVKFAEKIREARKTLDDVAPVHTETPEHVETPHIETPEHIEP